MAGTDVSSEKLRRHFESTYLSLRIGIAAIGAALPVALWVGALLLDGSSLQNSMSAYYYTGMRDVFVGAAARARRGAVASTASARREDIVVLQRRSGPRRARRALFNPKAAPEAPRPNVLHARRGRIHLLRLPSVR